MRNLHELPFSSDWADVRSWTIEVRLGVRGTVNLQPRASLCLFEFDISHIQTCTIAIEKAYKRIIIRPSSHRQAK